MAKIVTLTIDGRTASVPEGTLIVNAAKQIGIDIPVFCYHPKMEPVGMCRQCLVEVGRPVIDRATGQPVLEDGKAKIGFGPKLETACTTPVSDGMVVLSGSEKAVAAQKEILEFLLTSHPLDCPVCDKGGECPLQNLTLAHGPSVSRYLYDEKHHAEKHVPLGDLIFLDRERCIQCARCIRFQEQVAGEPVLSFYQRGRSTDIVTHSEPPFDSIFSGNTTDICPVGALTTADFRFGARPWEMKAAASICAQCAVGCNLTLNTRREASSGGGMVIKRVLPRQNEQVNEIWLCDKGRFAYHFVEDAARLEKPLVRKGEQLAPASWQAALQSAAGLLSAAGREAVVLASGRLSNEDLFNLKQLADGLGAPALLYTQMGGGAWTTAFGLSSGSDLGQLGPGTTVLVVASDLYHEAPIWHLRLKQAAERGATLIVATARETRLEHYAKYAVRYAYGDEIETVMSLRTKDRIGAALSQAENLVVVYGSDGLGLEGTSALAAACAELIGPRAGKANNGLLPVWPRANDQGAWELDFQPAADLAKALKGKTVYIVAADPAGDDPALLAALKGARAVLVQELFLSASAQLAEVVLPAQAYTERDGSFTSGERRVQRFFPAVPPRGASRADYAITAGLAHELGIELEGRGAALVMERLAAAVPNFSGFSYQKLSEVQPQWPIIGRADLYFGGTSYENRQGLGAQLALRSAPAPSTAPALTALRPDEEHWLAVPVTRLYDLGISVATSPLLAQRTGPASVWLHPDSAGRLGVEAGGQVRLGSTRLEVCIDAGVPSMVALVPRSMGLALHAPTIVDLKKA